MSNIKPQDPVTLGLCSQIELDEAVRAGQLRETRRREREEKEQAKARAAQLAAAEAAGMPSTQPVADEPETPAPEGIEDSEQAGASEPTAEDVFADEHN